MSGRLWLSNWGSWQTPGQVGASRRLGVQVAPLPCHWGDGTVPALHPDLDDRRRLKRGTISLREYLIRYRVRLSHALQRGELGPGQLQAASGWSWFAAGEFDPPVGGHLVQDGDSLLCSCPRRGSPRWRHPCHTEIAAEYLCRAGWGVTIYGQELVLADAACGRVLLGGQPYLWGRP